MIPIGRGRGRGRGYPLNELVTTPLVFEQAAYGIKDKAALIRR
jgi:hypothetical protein